MARRLLVSLYMMFFILGISGVAKATLINNGDGTITQIRDDPTYGDNSTLLWLMDANYAQTSSYDGDGKMTWDEAVRWATNLTYAGFDDWRLPSRNAISGYNQTDGDMGYLFYVELGNLGFQAPDGTYPQPGYGLSNTGPFYNVQPFWYWLDDEYIIPTSAYLFSFHIGTQGPHIKADPYYYAWAVRDAAPIPEPATILLFGTGLAGLAGTRLRRKKN